MTYDIVFVDIDTYENAMTIFCSSIDDVTDFTTVSSIYDFFDKSLGLKYEKMTDRKTYKFKLKNKKKWFLSKIKYGL